MLDPRTPKGTADLTYYGNDIDYMYITEVELLEIYLLRDQLNCPSFGGVSVTEISEKRDASC